MKRRNGFRSLSMFLGIAMSSAIGSSTALGQQVGWLGAVRVPGTSEDLSGMKGTLETDTPANAFGGLSAIDYTGVKNRYLVLSDRGPGDGAATFSCRMHEVDLLVSPASGKIEFELVSTTILQHPSGSPLVGSYERLKAWDRQGHAPSFDPEGIRVLPDAKVAISEEYGPSIAIFHRNGDWERSFAVPARFALSEFRATPWMEGTFTNRGLEGLAVTPNGEKLVAVMQGPLVQDGRIENRKCFGLMTRWIVGDLKSGTTQEWVYPLEDEANGVSEVLAVDANRFLVLERDSRAGSEASFKRIYLADASKASDVSSVASLKEGLPTGLRPISKRLLIDLLHPDYGFHGPDAPEKPEGLSWGPMLPDGRRLLMVCYDNDFNPEFETIFAAFAIANL
jgi:hypothetical protein